MNPIERAMRHVDDVQQRHTPLAFVFGIVKKFGDDNAGLLVANLAYSAFVCVFPLLLVLVTVLAVVLSDHPVWRHAVLNSTFSEFPLVGQQLRGNIHALRRSSLAGLVVGLAGLVWGAGGLAQSGLFAMAQVWNLPGPQRPGYIQRLGRGLLFLGVLGSGLLVSAALSGFGTFGRHNLVLGLVAEVVAATINIGQFWLAFRVLTPKVVPWRQLVPGAVVGGIAWTLLLALGGYLVGHDLRNDSTVYGTFGVVLGLVAWVYLGAEISVYAAEVNVVLARRLWPRAMVQPPLTEADQRSLASQATQNQRRPEQHIEVTFKEPAMTQRQLRSTPPDRGSAQGAGAPTGPTG